MRAPIVRSIARVSRPDAIRTGRIHHLLIAAWLLSMIAVPVILWVLGEVALRWIVALSVALQAAAVIATLHTTLATRRVLLIAALVLPAAWAVEWLGSTTGFPFGVYAYTDRLTPQLGHVPLIIPLAWLMMLPPAWAVAHCIAGESRGIRFALLSGLAFMAWDLFLDPQMVSWGYWVWAEQPMWLGGYFGIPWINFFGWAASAALLTGLVTACMRLEPLPVTPLLAIYIATWLLETGGQAAMWGLPGPALAGFLGMGLFVALAVRAPGVHRARAQEQN